MNMLGVSVSGVVYWSNSLTILYVGISTEVGVSQMSSAAVSNPPCFGLNEVVSSVQLSNELRVVSSWHFGVGCRFGQWAIVLL